MKSIRKRFSAILAVCIVIILGIPASAVFAEEMAGAVEDGFFVSKVMEVTEVTEENDLSDGAEAKEEALLTAAGKEKTVAIDAPSAGKRNLVVLDADFEAVDGSLLHAKIGSLTGENRAAVLTALKSFYDIGSETALKLVHEDFIDVEKWDAAPIDPFDEGLSDDALCWAASVSGLLWSSGWARDRKDPATGESFLSEDAFFTWLSGYFANTSGEAKSALDWFYDGTYLASGIGRNPWVSGDKNEGKYPEILAECLYENVHVIDDPDALFVMDRLSGDAKMPAFEASIGALEDGIAAESGHSVTALGLITNPSAREASEKYRAILLADPDNDASPTIPVEGSNDEERIADRSSRPNSYTIYPLRLITDGAGKKCWEIVGYGTEEGTRTVLFDLLYLPAKTEAAIQNALETEGSCDVYKDPDYLISDGITAEEPSESYSSVGEPKDEFQYGEDIWFNFRLLNKGVSNYPDETKTDIPVRLRLERNGVEYSDEIRTISREMWGPIFFIESLRLNENIELSEGKYTLTAEINPSIDGKRLPESYYRNNRSITLTFTVEGGKEDPKPDPKPDPTPIPVRDDDDDDNNEPLFTGTWSNAVKGGQWTQDKNGIWHYTSTEPFRATWGYIMNPYAGEGQNKADWFWFDRHGNMLTGWQYINGKWYYLNPTQDGTLGACLLGPGKTPDGYEIDASGAWTGR